MGVDGRGERWFKGNACLAAEGWKDFLPFHFSPLPREKGFVSGRVREEEDEEQEEAGGGRD